MLTDMIHNEGFFAQLIIISNKMKQKASTFFLFTKRQAKNFDKCRQR